MSEPWFRFYSSVVNDPKVQRLPDKLFKMWVNLLCLAKMNNGVLPDIADLAFALRRDESGVAKDFEALKSAGLFDIKENSEVTPHNWESRQFAESTKRVRKFRERSSAASGSVDETLNVTQSVTVDETVGNRSRAPPRAQQSRADTDSDTEHSRAEARNALADLEGKLRKAAGWENETSPKLSVVGQIQAVIDAGASLEHDVLPVIAALAPKVRKRTSWAYFVDAIREAHERRIAAGKPLNGKGQGPPKTVDWTKFSHRDYENVCNIARSRDEWFDAYGPPDKIPLGILDDELRGVIARTEARRRSAA